MMEGDSKAEKGVDLKRGVRGDLNPCRRELGNSYHIDDDLVMQPSEALL